MASVIYIPGFRDHPDSPIGKSVQWYAAYTGQKFVSTVLPGHTSSHIPNYSLTLTERRVSEILESIEGLIHEVIAYSFSSGPVIHAIEKSRIQVKALTLINPALNPLQAVVNFYNRFVGRNGNSEKHITVEDFLSNPKKILRCITRGEVVGDTKGFVSDLQSYPVTPSIISHFQKYIAGDILFRILVHPQDPIINSGEWGDKNNYPIVSLSGNGNHPFLGQHFPSSEEVRVLLEQNNFNLLSPV